jgi:hypothetical protein
VVVVGARRARRAREDVGSARVIVQVTCGSS